MLGTVPDARKYKDGKDMVSDLRKFRSIQHLEDETQTSQCYLTSWEAKANFKWS